MSSHAESLIETLRLRGVEVELRDGQVSVRPSNLIPAELIPALQRNRAALLAFLLREREWGKTFAAHGVTEEQAASLVGRIVSEGCVPVWSDILGDLVYFCRDEQAAQRAPRGVPAYTMEEIGLLYGDPVWRPSESGMRLINTAKLMGGRIVDVTDAHAGGSAS